MNNKNTTLSEHPKSQKQAKSIHLTHNYMTVHVIGLLYMLHA